MAAENNDELVKSIFGASCIEDHHFARFFHRNMEAMDAFFARKEQGLDLSQKVWMYTGQLKTELEDSLDLAIGEGTPANRLATKIQKYLQEPIVTMRDGRYCVPVKSEYRSEIKGMVHDTSDSGATIFL